MSVVPTRPKTAFAIALATVLALLPGAVPAQTPAADSLLALDSSEVMIPMRDGLRLHAMVVRLRGRHDSLPIVLTRTPYGVARSASFVRAAYSELARDGYVFVFEDIRGRFKSEGQFLMNRPLHDSKDPKGVDESTDTYDTIDWLITHLPGTTPKVGVLGVSYPGWLAAMAGIHPHPALKAISPQAPMTDTWMGDDFFHQGAFRLSYGFEYAAELEQSNDMSVPPPIPTYDTYDWYLAQGPLSTLTRLLGGHAPTWRNFTEHPTYDAFWKARALPTYLTSVSVPTMTVGGWWDQEDFYGALKAYASLEPHDAEHRNVLVVGPWNHGGWDTGDGRTLGKIDFGSAAGRYFREKIQAPWFAHWLHGTGSGVFPEAQLFESGDNRWRSFDRWPAPGVTARKLYFRDHGRLAFEAPGGTDAAASDRFVSDPAHPVPYRERPIQWTYNPRGSGWYEWLTESQRFVDNRPDVLTWQTEPLTEDVTIGGDIVAHLLASTTGSDADWVVKLIDVYPDSVAPNARMGNYELMVASDIMRGRYRTGFSHPTRITPNAIEAYTVDLHQQSYRFRAGHRIMVQVQSTWFPAYDRNPQTYVPNIFEAKASDYRSATHRVYRSARHASYVSLPVLPE